MALSREQLSQAFQQLNNNIAALEQQKLYLENSLDQAHLQRSVSALFFELNDSSEKTFTVPACNFAHAVNSSPGFFRLEAAGEMEFEVTRIGKEYTTSLGNRCFFTKGELDTLTANSTWVDGKTTVKSPGYRASPAFYFPGCEPKPVEVVVSVAEVNPGNQYIEAPTEAVTENLEPTPSVAN